MNLSVYSVSSASSFPALDVNMPKESAKDVAFSQAKDNYRGKGQARAIAIQQGKLPPIKRVTSAKHPAFVAVDDAAVKPNQDSRASTLEDVAEKPHGPDLVYHAQIASDAFEAGLELPHLEDIETFERPAGSAASSDERMAVGRQLEEEREARHSHRERLHNLNTWQFRSLIKDVIQQEDFEIKDGARSRAMSGDRPIAKWSEKQRAYLTKLQLETATKFTEHTLIRQLPLMTAMYPPRSAVPPSFVPPGPTNGAAASPPLRHPPGLAQSADPGPARPNPTAPTRSASLPHQHNVAPANPAPLSSQQNPRLPGALPISRSDYDAMSEAERYNVARFLHSDRNPTHWRLTWSEDDSEALWAVYSVDYDFQTAVKAFVESKQTTDPRKR